MFRTNGYPSVCADTTGRYWLAWSQRTPTATDDSRVLVATSNDGLTWSAPVLVDSDFTGRGHQFMPSVACTADRATVLWYDQRKDNAAQVFGPLLFGRWVMDIILDPPVHTLDVRAATTAPPNADGRLFDPSVQVSRYQGAIVGSGAAMQLVQIEANPVNWPLYAGGSVPFIGDYIDLAPARSFKPPMSAGDKWSYYDKADDTGVLHAAWTDNRDIIKPPLDADWSSANWAPPGRDGCVPNLVSIKNQNVYTSRLSRGLVVGVEGNSRRVASTAGTTTTMMRAFALFIQNTTGTELRLKLTTGLAPWQAPDQPPGGSGFFDLDGTSGVLYASVGPRMTIARTVFVPDGQQVPVAVNVAEVTADGSPVAGGLRGSALINSDITAPPPSLDIEVYTPLITDAFVDTYANPTFINPTYINPTYINPTFINPTYINDMYVNPTFINPTYINPTFINPTYINPTYINPTYINDTYINPTYINPTFINPTYINQPLVTDVSWQVTNGGNVAAGYNFGAVLASIPSNATFQLLVNRVYRTPSSSSCVLKEQVNADLLAVVDQPKFAPASGGNPSPQPTNVTFALPAGDMAVVTLRVIHGTATADGTAVPTFDPKSATAVTVAQASDPNEAGSYVRTAPAISVPPAGLTVEATGPSGAVVDYLRQFAFKAVDWTGTSISFSCLPLSGSTFGVRTTTVTCTAEDADHMVGSASFPVTVTDKTAPTMSTTADFTVEATGSNGATVTFTAPTATDVVDGSGLPVTCDWTSPSTFPIAATTVHCSAQDAAGNKVSTSFIVTVRDTTPPTVSVPASRSVEATGASGAVVTYTATATDIVDGAIVPACVPASGSTFALGTTSVSCTATDATKNTRTETFTVTVTDKTAPTVTVAPGSVTVEATGPTGAVVSYTVSASDLVEGVMTPTCSVASPRTFPIGATTVTCSATDSAGNTGAASFTVTVRDTTPPVLTLPAPIVTEATSASGATVSYAASATDIVDLAVAPACTLASGSTFPVAVTTVTCTATDKAGNTSKGTFTVTVKDSTAPSVVEAATPTTLLWSPNKTMTPITVSGKVTDVSRISSVAFSVWDEYGKVQPSGPVTLNADGTYSFTVKLEAWRQGTDSNGRQYIITVTATDAYGNQGKATTQVWVPHN